MGKCCSNGLIYINVSQCILMLYERRTASIERIMNLGVNVTINLASNSRPKIRMVMIKL
jgi:hypothetical protein